MADIFSEVDEDLRRDQLHKLWHRHGHWLVLALVALFLGIGGYEYWQNRQQTIAEAEGLRHAEALALLQAGKTPQAIQALDALARDGRTGYGLMARFEAALLSSSDHGEGLRAIADDGGVDAPYRDMARILWSLRALDSTPPAKIIAEIQPLTIPPGPWRFTAQEVVALAQLRAGDRKAALAAYQTLSDDPDAPASVRARAAEIIESLKS